MTAIAEAPEVNGTPVELPSQAGDSHKTTAVAVRHNPLPAKIQYAKALAESGLLPAAFRRNPGNVLFAVEYGEMLGLPPMAAMLGIYVIDGKPSAYASLISALVRKAGHKLRVGYDEHKRMGWAEIVRADDPGFTFRSEWDLNRAVTAELCTIKNGEPYATDSKGRSLPWRKFFPSMTKARAVTEAARDACEEALYGLHYTPEELGAEVDEDGRVVNAQLVDDGPPASQEPAGTGQDAGDPWYVRPAHDAGAEWVTQTITRVGELTGEECRELWREATARRVAGEITDEDSVRVKGLLAARVEDLKKDADAVPAEAEVIEGTVVEGLDPEDPWAAKVETVTCEDDAEDAKADVLQQVKSGRIPQERADVIVAAIDARAASLGSQVTP